MNIIKDNDMDSSKWKIRVVDSKNFSFFNPIRWMQAVTDKFVLVCYGDGDNDWEAIFNRRDGKYVRDARLRGGEAVTSNSLSIVPVEEAEAIIEQRDKKLTEYFKHRDSMLVDALQEEAIQLQEMVKNLTNLIRKQCHEQKQELNRISDVATEFQCMANSLYQQRDKTWSEVKREYNELFSQEVK
jgi:hypothetical protein